MPWTGGPPAAPRRRPDADGQQSNTQVNGNHTNGEIHRLVNGQVNNQLVAHDQVTEEGHITSANYSPTAKPEDHDALEEADDLLPQTLQAQIILSQALQAAAELAAEGLEAENAILRRALAEAETDAMPVRARVRALQRVSHRQQRLIDLQWLMLHRRGVEVPHSVLGEGHARTQANQASQANSQDHTQANGMTDSGNRAATSDAAADSAATNVDVSETPGSAGNNSDTTETRAVDAMTLLTRAERSLASASDSLSALGVLLQGGNTTVGHVDIMALKRQIDGLHRTWAPLPAYLHAHASQRANAAGQRLVDGMGAIEAYWTKD